MVMLLAGPDESLGREYADTTDRHPHGRLKVVVVDDNVEIVDRVAGALDKHFEIVGKFYDGESVLRELPQLKPDVIVLDISMEKLSGFEWRSDSGTAHVLPGLYF